MESKTKGSFEGWDEVWSTQSEEDLTNPMYTESKPTTIYQFWQKGYANDLLALIKNKNYQSFCELGSGRGTTTMYLAQAGYNDLTMVDLAQRGFEIAKYSFGKHNLPMPKMILENIEKTSLADQNFDCIYNIGLLEHFDDPRPTLAESFRLLKPGGIIYMPIVPEQPVYKSIAQRLLFNPIALAKITAKRILKPGTKNSNINRTNYRRDFYGDICKELGFKNVKCIPYNPYWKVNADGAVENKLTLPAYQWYYNTFKSKKTLSLETSPLFDLCFLLYAEK